MRQLAKYSFANAKIRAMLSHLIDPAAFSLLLDSKDIFDVIEGLKKTSYGQLFENRSQSHDINIADIEKKLISYDVAVHKKVADMLSSPAEKEFVLLLLQRYEIEELKVFIRIWHNKTTVLWEDYSFGRRICFDIDFKKLLDAANIEEFILLLDHTPYKTGLLKARENYKQRGSSFYLEAGLDLDYYQRLISCIDRFSAVDSRVARRILGIEVDGENINWLIRLRKYYSLGIGEMLEWFIPGGERIDKDTIRQYYTTDGLAKVVESVALGPYARIKDLVQDNILLIENFLFEFLLREVKKALSGFPFTIGTVMGYLILKRKETRNIISILNAKQYGWRKEEIYPLLSL